MLRERRIESILGRFGSKQYLILLSVKGVHLGADSCCKSKSLKCFISFSAVYLVIVFGILGCSSSNDHDSPDAGDGSNGIDSADNDHDSTDAGDGSNGIDGADGSCLPDSVDLWVDVILGEKSATVAVREAFTECTDDAGRPYSQDSGLPIGPRTPEGICIDVDYCCYVGGFCENPCMEGCWFEFDDGREPVYLGANDYSDFSAGNIGGTSQLRLVGCCEEITVPVTYKNHGIQFTDLIRTQERIDLSYTTDVPITSASISVGWSDPGDPHATYCAIGNSQVGSLHDDNIWSVNPGGIGLGIRTYRQEEVFPVDYGEITFWSRDRKRISESSFFTMINYSPSAGRWTFLVYNGSYDTTLVWGESERGIFKATESVGDSTQEHDLLLSHFSIDDSGSDYDISVVISSLLIRDAAMEYHAGIPNDTLLWETREGTFEAEFPHVAPVDGLELLAMQPDIYELTLGPVEVTSTDGILPPRTVEIHLLVDFGVVPRPVLE